VKIAVKMAFFCVIASAKRVAISFAQLAYLVRDCFATLAMTCQWIILKKDRGKDMRKGILA